jgi:hypothetical protein
MCLHLVARPGPADDRCRSAVGVRETVLVDVVQRDGQRPVQLGDRAEVGEDVTRDLLASSPDDRDPPHARKCSIGP